MDDDERYSIIWSAADRWADYLASLLDDDDFYSESDRADMLADLSDLEQALMYPMEGVD